jgi:hypothetical protein
MAASWSVRQPARTAVMLFGCGGLVAGRGVKRPPLPLRARLRPARLTLQGSPQGCRRQPDAPAPWIKLRGYQRYGFVIAENLTFQTANEQLRGSWQPEYGPFDNGADMLTITGEIVEIFTTAEDE